MFVAFRKFHQFGDRGFRIELLRRRKQRSPDHHLYYPLLHHQTWNKRKFFLFLTIEIVQPHIIKAWNSFRERFFMCFVASRSFTFFSSSFIFLQRKYENMKEVVKFYPTIRFWEFNQVTNIPWKRSQAPSQVWSST